MRTTAHRCPATQMLIRFLTSLLSSELLFLMTISSQAQNHEVGFADRSLTDWRKQLTHQDISQQVQAMRAIARIGPPAKAAVPALIDALHHKDSRSYWAACALAELGTEATVAIVPLTTCLRRTSGLARAGATLALIKLGKPAVPALLMTLRDNDPEARLSAVHVLGKIGPKAIPAVPLLRELLKTDSPKVRCAAASALWAIAHDDLVIMTLRESLQDPDRTVRQDAAEAVGEIGPDAKLTTPLLVKLLTDKHEAVRNEAVRALGIIGPDAKAAVPSLIAIVKAAQEFGPFRDSVVECIWRIGPLGVPALVEALKDLEEARVLGMLADSLGRIGPRAQTAVPALLRLLNLPDGALRVKVAFALWQISQHEAALPALVRSLGDKKNSIRWNAAEALAKIGPPAKSSTDALTKNLEKGDRVERRFAATALGRIGPAARDATGSLALALRDPDPGVRIGAAVALCQIANHAPAVTSLGDALKSKDELERQLAATAFSEIGLAAKRALPALVEALTDRDEIVFVGAAQALGNLGACARSAVPLLIKALTDERTKVSETAADSLKRIDRDAATRAGLH